MTAGFLGFTALSQKVSYRYRTLYVTTLLINAIAAVSYFVMASGLGKTTVNADPHSWSSVREVYYARYLDWLFT
jgi:bacteriorhodopsin